MNYADIKHEEKKICLCNYENSIKSDTIIELNITLRLDNEKYKKTIG